MDKFIVSARKYRPQNFNTVIGQTHITSTLKNAINQNQLAHAYLFCGPRGVGKTTCARILSKTINCESRTPDGEACNTCNSCTSFDQGISFNVHELDAASNNKVEDMRELIDQVRFAPQAGRYKVYIVDEVHMLSQSAFNAFLKTLEEPPPYAIFILATTEKHKILPTILSRCQIFDFKRITSSDTVAHLEEITKKENIKAERSALHVIAQKSEGCLRDALSILDKIVSFSHGNLTYSNTLEHLNILDEDYFFRFMEQLHQQQASDALLLYDEIHQKGFEGDTLLEGFAEFIRNILVSKDSKTLKLLDVSDDFKPRYLEAAQKSDAGWLISALNIISESVIQFKASRNKKLHVELALIKLSYLSQAIQLSSGAQGLEKKKLVESGKAVSFRALTLYKLDQTQTSKPSKPAPAASVGAKLTIETEPEKKPKTTQPEKKIQQVNPPVTADVERPVQKIGSLDAIRNQASKQLGIQHQSKLLEIEALNEAWKLYIEKLTAEQNHSTASNFSYCELKITDEHSFEVITESNIQQKFIESEKASLIHYMQAFFKDRLLKLTVTIIEKPYTDEPGERPLNSREIYAQMVEKNPLIQVLKEKLQMTIE
jgi:DNA polymerase-3 subunit gamma/tau